jgi:hypothetical protein
VGNVSEKTCKAYYSTHFMLSNFFFPENRAVCENVGGKFSRNKQATGDNVVWQCAVLMPPAQDRNTNMLL